MALPSAVAYYYWAFQNRNGRIKRHHEEYEIPTGKRSKYTVDISIKYGEEITACAETTNWHGNISTDL